MNPDNNEVFDTEPTFTEKETEMTTETQITTAAQPVMQPAPLKRPYRRRETKTPTIASLNEQIRIKELEVEAVQAEITGLTAKRNDLFFNESELMGLISLMADPEKSKWLAKKVEESNRRQSQ